MTSAWQNAKKNVVDKERERDVTKSVFFFFLPPLSTLLLHCLAPLLVSHLDKKEKKPIRTERVDKVDHVRNEITKPLGAATALCGAVDCIGMGDAFCRRPTEEHP